MHACPGTLLGSSQGGVCWKDADSSISVSRRHSQSECDLHASCEASRERSWIRPVAAAKRHPGRMILYRVDFQKRTHVALSMLLLRFHFDVWLVLGLSGCDLPCMTRVQPLDSCQSLSCSFQAQKSIPGSSLRWACMRMCPGKSCLSAGVRQACFWEGTTQYTDLMHSLIFCDLHTGHQPADPWGTQVPAAVREEAPSEWA